MKLYSAIYLSKEPPLVALPKGVKRIEFAPHVSLSVFESDVVNPQVSEYIREIEVSHAVYALHGLHTRQIMFVCPVITSPKLFVPSFITAEQGRFFHVTVGVLPMSEKTLAEYQNLTKIVNSDITSKLTSSKLVIEKFAPVKY